MFKIGDIIQVSYEWDKGWLATARITMVDPTRNHVKGTILFKNPNPHPDMDHNGWDIGSTQSWTIHVPRLYVPVIQESPLP